MWALARWLASLLPLLSAEERAPAIGRCPFCCIEQHTLNMKGHNMTVATIRSIHDIAADIRAHWSKIYFGAEPYLRAMARLGPITDHYYDDSAEDIVMYFLSNATTWRGEDARRIKAELKAMLKSV